MKNKIGLQRGIVKLQPWSADWQRNFETESNCLKQSLGNNIIDIQHIGSTSVKGLMAKPIIDMLMGIDSLETIKSLGVLLEQNGYEYRENGSDSEQVLYVKGPEDNRTHYLHITKYDSSRWRNDIGFRDYLRNHQGARDEYNEIKKRLAKKHKLNRKKYTEAKAGFIEKILLEVRNV